MVMRGAGGINVVLEMAENSSKAHVSGFPVGTDKKAHRHGPGAHLLNPERRRRLLDAVDEGRPLRPPQGGLEGRRRGDRAGG